ncbi:unnamed protein product, partial [Meganyctiphanes norvegica]
YDLETSKRIMEKYPSRYLRIEYERLTGDVEVEIKKLYYWMGQDFTIKAAVNLVKKTLGHTTIDQYAFAPWYNFISTRNTSAVRYAWRNRLSYQDMSRIQQDCMDVLHQLHYRVYTSQEEYEDPTRHPYIGP